MAVAFSNNACSGLVSGIDDSTTSITIGPEGVFFPQLIGGDWFYGTISNDPVLTSQLPEIVKVTAIAIDGGTGDYDLVVERGAGLDGALPKTWNADADFQLLVGGELLNDLVTGGISVAGATSWILNSKDILVDYTMTIADNGYYINASPGATDISLSLPEIPATGTEDIRYFINKKTLTADGAVNIDAFSGQTINGYNTMDLRQQYSTVMLHTTPGSTNWTATENVGYQSIPDDGNVYGITYGPNWITIVEEAPQDGGVYIRQDGDWVPGVNEAPIDGQTYIRQDGSWTIFDASAGGGTTSAVPAGTMITFAGMVQPLGYVWCDGQSYARGDFAELFTIIGTSYGAVDSTSFNVPDMRGRTARGLDNLGGAPNANVYPGRTTIGGTAGAYQFTLSSSQMPSHSHSIGSGGGHTHSGSTNSAGNHSHTYTKPTQSASNGTDPGINKFLIISTANTSSSGSHSHSMSINTAGSHSHSIGAAGGSTAIQPATPFMDLNWLIKI